MVQLPSLSFVYHCVRVRFTYIDSLAIAYYPHYRIPPPSVPPPLSIPAGDTWLLVVGGYYKQHDISSLLP